MFSLTTLAIVGAAALLVGCILGSLLSRTLSPQQQKARTLETKLQEAEQQLKEYQQEVTDHFAETSKLVNNLTQSYRDVHEHLASDALKLANVDISRQLLSNANGDDTLLGDTSINEEDFQPPKDWAPKTPGAEGTLSEGYGLKESEEYAEQESNK
ncbi:MAG: YhcB family protein [Cellvibrionaceae bacterium]